MIFQNTTLRLSSALHKFYFFYLLVLETTRQRYSNINTALTGIYKSEESLLGMTRTWPSFLLQKQECSDNTQQEVGLSRIDLACSLSTGLCRTSDANTKARTYLVKPLLLCSSQTSPNLGPQGLGTWVLREVGKMLQGCISSKAQCHLQCIGYALK